MDRRVSQGFPVHVEKVEYEPLGGASTVSVPRPPGSGRELWVEGRYEYTDGPERIWRETVRNGEAWMDLTETVLYANDPAGETLTEISRSIYTSGTRVAVRAYVAPATPVRRGGGRSRPDALADMDSLSGPAGRTYGCRGRRRYGAPAARRPVEP